MGASATGDTLDQRPGDTTKRGSWEAVPTASSARKAISPSQEQEAAEVRETSSAQARRPAGTLRAGLDGCAHIGVCVLCVRVSCVRDRVLGGACQFGGSDLVEVRSAALRAAALAVGLPAEFPATAQGLLPSFDSAPQSPVPVPRRVRWRNGQTAFGASLQPARTPKLTTLPLPSTITAKLQPPLPNLPASPSLLAASLTRPRPPVARRLRLSLRALRCSRWMRARPGRPVSPARPVSRR